MTHDELYEVWKQEQAQAEVPAGFADWVMETVAGSEQRPVRRIVRGFTALLASRGGRAAICTLALVLFALRLASVLALFLPGLPEMGE